eukprot:758747-Hanusia_phi.AAC.3
MQQGLLALLMSNSHNSMSPHRSKKSRWRSGEEHEIGEHVCMRGLPLHSSERRREGAARDPTTSHDQFRCEIRDRPVDRLSEPHHT